MVDAPSQLRSPPLTAAPSVEAFSRNPVDHYVARARFCFWQLGTDAMGLVVWGHPTAEDAREMVQAFEVGTRTEHVSLVDMRDMASVDVTGFAVVMEYMARRQPEFARTVKRQAMVHGSGLVGAAVAGFYSVVRSRYPVRSFRDLEPALAWVQPRDPAGVRAVIESLRQMYVGVPEIVGRLRTCFEVHPALPGVDEVAKALGLSRRTLQRELSEAHTTFRDEAARFRLGHAERLLAGSNMSIKAVAAAIDLSPNHLAALFRRAHGMSPETWRESHRTFA